MLAETQAQVYLKVPLKKTTTHTIRNIPFVAPHGSVSFSLLLKNKNLVCEKKPSANNLPKELLCLENGDQPRQVEKNIKGAGKCLYALMV